MGTEPHVTIGTREEVLGADLVFVAVPWTRLGEALGGVDWTGRIVVDCTNALEGPSFKPVNLHGRTSSEAFADLCARCAGGEGVQPHLCRTCSRAIRARRAAVAYCTWPATTPMRKPSSAGIIDRIGFYRIDLGGLRDGGKLIEFPGGPLPALNMVVFD